MNTDEKLASVLRTLRHTSAALRTVSAALNTAAVDLAQVLIDLDVEIGQTAKTVVTAPCCPEAPPVDSVEAALEGHDVEAMFDA